MVCSFFLFFSCREKCVLQDEVWTWYPIWVHVPRPTKVFIDDWWFWCYDCSNSCKCTSHHQSCSRHEALPTTWGNLILSPLSGYLVFPSYKMLSKEDGVTTSVDIFSVGCMVIKLCDGRKQLKNEVSNALLTNGRNWFIKYFVICWKFVIYQNVQFKISMSRAVMYLLCGLLMSYCLVHVLPRFLVFFI